MTVITPRNANPNKKLTINPTIKMAEHIDTGRRGETIVADYLTTLGWRIVETRWRDTAVGGLRTDIDLIALSPDRVYHFVEVKTRTATNNIGTDYSPEAALTPAKAQRMTSVAERYMATQGLNGEIAVDLAAVVLDSGGQHPKIRYYPDIAR